MKAISILQPWATLLVIGAKRYETRSWQTKHRGPLLIHASRRFNETARQLFGLSPFYEALTRAGYAMAADLPLGAIVGQVEIASCIPTESMTDLTDQEKALGDFTDGRYAWETTNAV